MAEWRDKPVAKTPQSPRNSEARDDSVFAAGAVSDKDTAKFVPPNSRTDRATPRGRPDRTVLNTEQHARIWNDSHMQGQRVRELEAADGEQEWVGGLKDTGGASPEWHPWRFVTQDTTDSLQWGLTDSGADGTRAGRVLAPGGAATEVDSEWNDYTEGEAVSGWLKVTCSYASGLLTVDDAEIVTEEPTADPFNATAPIFVWPLFDLFADGTFTEYQTSDISMEGLGATGVPPGDTQYMVLQLNSSNVAVWGWVRAH